MFTRITTRRLSHASGAMKIEVPHYQDGTILPATEKAIQVFSVATNPRDTELGRGTRERIVMQWSHAMGIWKWCDEEHLDAPGEGVFVVGV